MVTQKDAYSKLFKDNNGKVTLWQSPNIPLLGWAVFSLLGHVLKNGSWQVLVMVLGFGFIFTWAWLEFSNGVNYFRRLLGLAVLIISVYSKLI